MMGVRNDLIFTEAMEQVEALVASNSSDEIGTRIEQIVKSEDLAMVCLMLLTMKAKGVDTLTHTGVELANLKPTILDLILPAGVVIDAE
jgi:hypothetical protein